MTTRITRRIAALIRAATAIVFLLSIGAPAARAQSADWNTAVTTGGSWGIAANWQGSIIPSGAGNTAGFHLDFTAPAAVTLDGNRIIGTIESSGANPWSLNPGSGGTLTVAGIMVTGGPLTVTIPLAGVTFAKDGPGALIFSNPDSSYTGTININAGILRLVGSANYSTSSNVVHLASVATLDVTQLAGGFRYGGAPDTRLNVHDGDELNGTGSVNGGLKVKAGGTVYPGDNGVGTLSVDGKGLFETGSNWKVKLGSANAGGTNTSNRLTFTTNLTLEAGMTMPIDGIGLTFTAGQTYDYLISTGAISFNLGAVIFQPANFDPSLSVSPADFSLIPDGTNLTLRFTPIPEPAFATVLCFGMIVCYCARRRPVTNRGSTPGN